MDTLIPLTPDPNTSEQAKQHAREVLEAAGVSVDELEIEKTTQGQASTSAGDDQHTSRVLAGYKATLHSAFHICASSEKLIDPAIFFFRPQNE